MPEPTRFSKPKAPKEDLPAPVVSGEIIEPRCHVCTSPYRRGIDRMLALGTGYSEISRVFGGTIDRRSISTHNEKHLSFQDAAVRRIIEHEIQEAQDSVEDGVQAMVERRVYARTALRKAFESLLAGDVTVEPKDALALSQYLDKLDTQTEGSQIEEIQIQFNAFVTAIKELAPNLFPAIIERTKEIVGVGVGIEQKRLDP